MSLVGWRKPFYFRILFAAAIASRTPDFSRIALTFVRAVSDSSRTAAI
jgi:hypothetical protein